MIDNQTSDPLTRNAGWFAAGVLAADALCHVYWLTGAVWPFADDHALSLAVLGFPAPFTAPVLVPLVLLLAVAATAVHHRLRNGPHGPVGRAAHLVTLAVATAAAVQVPVRIGWLAGLGGPGAGPVFPWLNPVLYLPLCALLALATFRVARRGGPRS